MKVTCIDFETANSFKGSICSVGITLIDGSNTVLSKTWLVKPNIRCVFTQANIDIHGITPIMVKDSPEFNVLYDNELKFFIENSILAAHWAEFDITAFKNVLTLYGIPIPSFEYLCTC